MGRAADIPTRPARVNEGALTSGVSPAGRARPDDARGGGDGPLFEDIGRVGTLVLRYERDGDQTVLAHSRCRSPWHVLPSMTLDQSGWAYSLLMNPSGGLVGGDALSIDVTVGVDARVLLSTPSATRIYRSPTAPVLQRIELHLRRGSVLEWLPEVTIPFAGSRFRQTIHATVEPGATLLLWDAFASGRIARQERWAFAVLENEVRICTASGATTLERTILNGADPIWDAALGRAWDYVGVCYLVQDGLQGDRLTALKQDLAGVLERQGPGVLGGVSEPSVPGVVTKLVARSAPDLSATLEALWDVVRAQLWGGPAPRLRRY